jgi:hypothetical protein
MWRNGRPTPRSTGPADAMLVLRSGGGGGGPVTLDVRRPPPWRRWSATGILQFYSLAPQVCSGSSSCEAVMQVRARREGRRLVCIWPLLANRRPLLFASWRFHAGGVVGLGCSADRCCRSRCLLSRSQLSTALRMCPPNCSIWTSPLMQREVERSITKDRLQRYISDLSAGVLARAIMENRPFAPPSVVGLERCRQVSLGPQTSV